MGPQTPTEVVAMASLDGWTPLPSLPRWLCCVGFAGGLEFGFDTRGGVCRVPPTPVTSEGVRPTHPPALTLIPGWSSARRTGALPAYGKKWPPLTESLAGGILFQPQPQPSRPVVQTEPEPQPPPSPCPRCVPGWADEQRATARDFGELRAAGSHLWPAAPSNARVVLLIGRWRAGGGGVDVVLRWSCG